MQNVEISYQETRQQGENAVKVAANPRSFVELEALLVSLRGTSTQPPTDPPPIEPPTEPPIEPPPIEIPPPTTAKPYYDIGDASGKPGDVVEVPVIGGCRNLTDGFHLGGGVGMRPEIPRDGYRKFRAVGVTLGPFIQGYLDSHNMSDAYYSIFQFVNQDHRALPEEWWEYAIGFFSITQERPPLPAIRIPVETLLFTIKIEILADTPSGEYQLTAKDEHYYTQSRPRRRDFLFTGEVSGGWTKIDALGGTLVVE